MAAVWFRPKARRDRWTLPQPRIRPPPLVRMRCRSDRGAARHGCGPRWSLGGLATWTGGSKRTCAGSTLPARGRISGGRLVAERWGQAPRHPLTADLAGVLAAAQHERAPAHGPDAVSWGIGAAVLRFAKGLADRVFLAACPANRQRLSGSRSQSPHIRMTTPRAAGRPRRTVRFSSIFGDLKSPQRFAGGRRRSRGPSLLNGMEIPSPAS